MKATDIARIVAEVMDCIIVIVCMTEQTDQEVIPPVQEANQVVQLESFGYSISLLLLLVMELMSYSE